jgi:putative phosphoserine phosphatase / 1-acylglycerol-3-phosphate O-acyltransferase
MAEAAAFFDLDRTLLRGASGPVITESLRAAGLVPDRHIPGEGLLYKFFDIVGETLPAMLLTRQAARVANGWNRAAVQAAGEEAAKRLIDDVQPFARSLIDQHHEACSPPPRRSTSCGRSPRPSASTT